MKLVALATTWNEPCGLAEYAKNLIENCRGVSFSVISRPLTLACIIDEARGHDILHINYEPGLFPWLNHFTAAELRTTPTVLTLHTSHDGDNRTPLTGMFDRVVVHEQTLDGFLEIPMGIPEHRPHAHPIFHRGRIGTFGFPFPWKGIYQVVVAAKSLNSSATVICAESRHWDVNVVKHDLMDLDPNVQIITQFLDQDKVIDILGRCEVNVFAYSGGNSGISGAVRQGLAACRPIVLTRCRQFRDLFKYDDEITFIENSEPATIAKGITEALAKPSKVPNRVLRDMSWSVAGQMYQQLYETL